MIKFIHPLTVILLLISLSSCFHSQQDIKRWELQRQGVTSFSLSRDGRFALTASTTDGILLWDLNENHKLADFGYQDPNKSTVLSSHIADNKRFAITATSSNFAIWDLAWGQASGLWSISDGLILDVAISDTGKHVLLALSNDKALFVDIDTGRRLEFLAHLKKVNSVAISANGKFALSGGNDGNAYLWDTATGQIIYQFNYKERITRVALQRTGELAFVADANANARIWNLKTGRLHSELDIFQRISNFSCARFSDTGQHLMTGTPSGIVSLWQTKTGKKQGEWHVQKQQNIHPRSTVVYDVALNQLDLVISASSSGVAQAWSSTQ